MILEEFLKISPDQTNIVELIEEFSLQLPDFINYQSEELTLKHKWATLYIICNIIQQNDIEETFLILVFVTIEPLLNIMILEEFLKISPDQTNIVELIEEFSLQLPDFINYQSEEVSPLPHLGKTNRGFDAQWDFSHYNGRHHELTLKHKWATLYIICNIIQQNDIEETFIILVFVTIEPLLNIMILEEFLKISPDRTNIVELIEEFSLQLPDFINYQSEELTLKHKWATLYIICNIIQQNDIEETVIILVTIELLLNIMLTLKHKWATLYIICNIIQQNDIEETVIILVTIELLLNIMMVSQEAHGEKKKRRPLVDRRCLIGRQSNYLQVTYSGLDGAPEVLQGPIFDSLPSTYFFLVSTLKHKLATLYIICNIIQQNEKEETDIILVFVTVEPVLNNMVIAF
ncbi:hypothetical protein NDU88_005787 [Pleurodeles waltl]|uniref:Uncharacterized protein n=1 Tax=Pleurodeles waltl TaxID=8319 RepID=A0AAV7WY31_PLEWA|nr:hypothetical protein NDU88_005787 [Pleurodeles waltl]